MRGLQRLIAFIHDKYPDVPLGITTTKALSDDNADTLRKAIETFKGQFGR